jgi:hypothetical protein
MKCPQGEEKWKKWFDRCIGSRTCSGRRNGTPRAGTVNAEIRVDAEEVASIDRVWVRCTVPIISAVGRTKARR